MKRLSSLVLTSGLAVAVAALGLVTAPAHAVAPPAGAVTTGDYCSANALPRNDDGSSPEVTLPFPVNFAGALRNTIYVNNNGNVTFGGGLSQYTPTDLTGPTLLPIIAPFFADVDTRNTASGQTTYGSSPDGKVFCVNWIGVGYYSGHADRTNSFQLLLVNRAGVTGGQAGDVDIQFNYDRVTWEAGDLSGGTGGLGGTSAAVGFSFGTGAAGTFFQFAGSGVPGSFLDGGPSALVSGSRNSLGQAGRYTFALRGGSAAGGDVTGTVLDPGGVGVASSLVEICPVENPTPDRCATTQSAGNGTFGFVGIPVGEFSVTAFPPPGSPLRQGQVVTTVTAGHTSNANVTLTRPGAMPAGTTITRVGMTANGIPVLHWDQWITLTQDGCKDGEATFAMSQNGGVIASGRMSEGPAGHYTARIPPLRPRHGAATVTITIECPDGTTEVTAFDVYIDPSGTVVDNAGRPVSGATVTLLRSDGPDGPFAPVATGSAIMSPGNRENPVTTGSDGTFAWDVVAGYYVVTAAAGTCTAQTAAMAVPPPQTGLVVTLPCSLTPAAPAKLRAKVRGTKVVLTWKRPAAPVPLTGYQAWVSKKDKKHWRLASASIAPAATRYVWRKAKHRTKYYVTVYAATQWGVGPHGSVLMVRVR